MYLSKRMDELRTELIHRFELLGNDLKTIRTKMVAFNKLTVYMLENNICEYTVDVGNAFIAFNESERGKCLGVIQSLNDCLTNNPWWFLNNVHSSYTISNSRVKECAERILQEMQTLQYKRASLSYTYLCYCRLDLYMIENQYTDYSADIGEKFLDGVKNVIPENQVRYFPYKYILPIKQLNEFISGGIGTFRIPDDYEFKNSTLKSACDDLTALLTSLNYTKSALSTHQTSLKLLDWYMCVKRISTYNEEVGNLFVQYMEQRCTTPKTDGHNVYVRATVCRLNDLLNNRGYIRYHHDHCIEIPDEIGRAHV